MNILKPIFFLFVFQNALAQNVEMNNYQDSLKTICKKLFVPQSDANKEKYNQQLFSTFERALNTNNSYNFEFDSLKIYMAVLRSPDNKFRIINWNVPKADGSQEYYGFIQERYLQVTRKGSFRKERKEIIQLYVLTDKSAETKNPENAITDNKKWYGMLYYKIIETHVRHKNYYTLLAWDGNDKFSSKKIIDVLTFDSNGLPKFGADIFNYEKKYPKRIIFEHAATCTMSLRYSSKKDSIVFDHLAPTQSQFDGQFQYYCNDGSYDGFGFKKGKWNYGKYLNAMNEKDEKDKFYNDPRKSTNRKESHEYRRKEKKKK